MNIKKTGRENRIGESCCSPGLSFAEEVKCLDPSASQLHSSRRVWFDSSEGPWDLILISLFSSVNVMKDTHFAVKV